MVQDMPTQVDTNSMNENNKIMNEMETISDSSDEIDARYWDYLYTKWIFDKENNQMPPKHP